MATGKISIYHPNMKGTGGALQISVVTPHETENGESVDGSVFLHFAPQATVGDITNGKRVFPTFDWENKAIMRLTLLEVSEIIGVFRGYKESLCDGKGFFHKSPKANSILTIQHKLEPTPGFWIGISRKPIDGDIQKIGIFLSMNEASALEMSLSGAMSKIAFGV